MDTSQHDLERALSRLAEQGDNQAAEDRLLARLPVAGSSKSPARRLALAALGGAAATVGVVAALNIGGVIGDDPDRPEASSQPTAPRTGSIEVEGQDGPAGLVGPGEPCPGSVSLPAELAAIRGAVKVPVWKPTAAPISRAWRCGDTPVLMLDGVQVSYEAGWSGVDLEKKWDDLARDYGGSVTTIAGHPALVQTAGEKSDSSQVLIVEGDTLIRFLATSDVPVDTVTTLAESLPLK